jgi:hypothetical protein
LFAIMVPPVFVTEFFAAMNGTTSVLQEYLRQAVTRNQLELYEKARKEVISMKCSILFDRLPLRLIPFRLVPRSSQSLRLSQNTLLLQNRMLLSLR